MWNMKPVQKVSDFIFPRKTSDGRLANLITVVVVVGGNLHVHA
jgi:hypothetical protein